VIGNLKEKDMAMLEERIKRQAKTRPLPGTEAVPVATGSKPAAGGPKINPPTVEKAAGSGIPGVRSRPGTAGSSAPSGQAF